MTEKLKTSFLSEPKQKVVKIIFKAENINQVQTLCYRNYNRDLLEKFIQTKTEALNLNKNKVTKFLKDGQKFLKFQKGKHDQILQRDQLTVQYLYTKKRDQLQKKLNKFSQIVQNKFNQIKEINDQYKEGSNKVMILRKLVSTQTTAISQNLQSKNQINITLLISDPLVKQVKNNQGANFQGIDFQEHVKKLQECSVSSKGLKIELKKKIAFLDTISNFFPKRIAFSGTKIIRIVTFFTKISRGQDNQLYISFQNQKIMGQQKLVKAQIFFSKIVPQWDIDALLIIGLYANLLSAYKTIQFPIILISTYSFNIDKGMRFFVQNFYQHIFQKKQIQESYNLASINYKKSFYDTNYQNQYLCCCLHEHKKNCSWQKIIDKIGISLAHKIFNHQSIRSTQNYNILQPLQQILLENMNEKCCSSLSERCCLPDHTSKGLILKKTVFIQAENKQNLWNLQQDSQFNQQKNKFQKKDNFQKLSTFRRCPTITFEIIQKILNGKQIVTFIGNKKVGKGYLIQASRLYIQQRRNNFCFQYIQFTESSLEKQLASMFKIAKDKKAEFKKLVFIHNNYSISFQAQFFKKIKEKKKGKNLPFTILIKIIKPEIEYNTQQRGSPIIIGKLHKIELLAEVLFQLPFKYYKTKEQIKQIQQFCQSNKQKLTYKTIRNFLKYFKEKETTSVIKNKSLIQQYNLINMEFKQRMSDICNKSQILYEFIGFLAQFQQGVYLIKLNSLILSQFFNMSEIKKHLNNRENTFNILDISSTLIRSKDGAKSQQILFILPQQSVVNYFNQKQQRSKYVILKYQYFYCLFQILWKVVKQNRNALFQKIKITSDVFFDGIFMLQIQAKNMIKNQHEIIQKTCKSIVHFYSQKYNLIQNNESKKKRKNSIQNKIKTNKQLIGQKMLKLLFLQVEKYILHHHSTNFSSMIENYGNLIDIQQSKKYMQTLKSQITTEKGSFNKQLLCRLSLIIICKKVLIIYDIVLKQSFDYQNLKNNIKNCAIHLQEELNKKDSLNRQKNQLRKFQHLKKSVSNLQESKKLTGNKHLYSRDQYFSELICLVQLQSLLKMKISALPKIQIHSKSQQYLPHLKQVLDQIQSNNQNQKSKQQISQDCFIPDQQFQIMQILNKLVNYQKNKCQINKLRKSNYDNISYEQIEQMIIKLDQSINLITDLLDIVKIFKVQKYHYLNSLTQDRLFMQILTLLMEKIKVHYQIYQQHKSSFKKLLPRINYKTKSLDFLLNYYYKLLYNLYENKTSNCYKKEEVKIFLKNVQLCKKYILFVLQNDKNDFDFQSFGDNIYEQYQKIFSFLKQKTCKKVIFNSQNLIVFMKSRVMMFRNYPYAFIRKRNVTMKYIKKILHKRDVKISFFALNRSNFSLLQIDSNNKKCQIYYLVLTVDTIIENGELKLLFQQTESIHEDLIELKQFIQKLSKMNIIFLLITGKNAKTLCQQLKKRLQDPPILIALQNQQYSLNNYVPYVNQNIIQQEDQFLTKKCPTVEQNHVNQISKYMDIQIYHSMLDLIICSIIALLTQMTDQNYNQFQQSNQNTNEEPNHPKNYNLLKQIQNIVYKSIRRSKDILWPIWQGIEEKQMEIQYKVFIKNQQQQNNLQNIPSLDRINTFPIEKTLSLEKQEQFKTKYSMSQNLQNIILQNNRFLPRIKKGQLKDLSSKIHQSPNNLIDETYYQNVGRHLEVCYIIQHLKGKGQRISIIQGDKKSGKSNLANQICWISHTRKLFKDGVYKYDMRQLRNCMFTIPEYIQVHHLQQKLYNILKHSQFKDQESSSFLICLQNFSKLDLTQKQNLDFFLNLNKKAVCLLLTTNEQDLLEDLQKYLAIQVFILRKKNDTNEVKIVKETKNRFQLEHSENYIQSSHKNHNQKWALLKVNINKISKDQLFCIALSYLKRKEIYNSVNDLKQYISKNYAKYVINIMKQIDQKQQESTNQPLLASIKSNHFNSLSQEFERTFQFQHLRREKSCQQGRSKSKQTVNKLPKLFQRLEQELNITNKQDTRINFYQECFEQLLSQNKTYNKLSISFK